MGVEERALRLHEVDAGRRVRGRRRDRRVDGARRWVRGGRSNRRRGGRRDDRVVLVPGVVGVLWKEAGDWYVVGRWEAPRM